MPKQWIRPSFVKQLLWENHRRCHVYDCRVLMSNSFNCHSPKTIIMDGFFWKQPVYFRRYKSQTSDNLSAFSGAVCIIQLLENFATEILNHFKGFSAPSKEGYENRNCKLSHVAFFRYANFYKSPSRRTRPKPFVSRYQYVKCLDNQLAAFSSANGR